MASTSQTRTARATQPRAVGGHRRAHHARRQSPTRTHANQHRLLRIPRRDKTPQPHNAPYHSRPRPLVPHPTRPPRTSARTSPRRHTKQNRMLEPPTQAQTRPILAHLDTKHQHRKHGNLAPSIRRPLELHPPKPPLSRQCRGGGHPPSHPTARRVKRRSPRHCLGGSGSSGSTSKLGLHYTCHIHLSPHFCSLQSFASGASHLYKPPAQWPTPVLWLGSHAVNGASIPYAK